MAVYRVLFHQAIPSIGAQYYNVCHFDNVGGLTTESAIAAELASTFMPKIQQFQSNFLGWQYFYIYDTSNPSAPPYIYNAANSPGLSTAAYIYPTNCIKLKWQGTFGGRKGRGRFYIAGTRADWVNNAGVTASGMTNGGVHLASIVDRYKQGGTGPLVLGIYNGAVPEADFHSLESATIWQYIGIQRRRNYGVGI